MNKNYCVLNGIFLMITIFTHYFPMSRIATTGWLLLNSTFTAKIELKIAWTQSNAQLHNYKFTLNSSFCHNVLNILFLFQFLFYRLHWGSHSITGCKNPKEFLLQCKTISYRIFLDSCSFGDQDWLLRNWSPLFCHWSCHRRCWERHQLEFENVMFSRTFLCNWRVL